MMSASLVLVVALWSPGLVELEEEGRNHLYNMDYARAREVFSELSERSPASPIGPYYEATTLWMEEFTRRGGMAGSTFRTGRYWAEKHREPVSATLEREFMALVVETADRADAILERDPNHSDALYFRGAAEGLLSAYYASIEHRYYQSYQAGKRAKRFHERLLEVDADYADACLLPGIYEYTVATLPKTLRIVGFLIGVRGSREKGIELVERAVADGDRTRWVARLSLTVLSQREKKYQRSLRILRELEQAFPKNPLLPLERGNIHLLRKDYESARRAFDQVWSRRVAGTPNYMAVEPALIKLMVAESHLFDKEFANARDELNRALGIPDVPDRIKAVVYLRRGMASDGLADRKAAEWDYRRALRMDADELTNRLAERYLDEPFR